MVSLEEKEIEVMILPEKEVKEIFKFKPIIQAVATYDIGEYMCSIIIVGTKVTVSVIKEHVSIIEYVFDKIS